MTVGATAFRYAFIVALGGFVFGLDAALISGAERFVTVDFGLSDLEIGAVVSAPGFGVIFALLAAGHIAALIGRRKTLLIIAALYLVSAVASVFAPNFESLVAARFLGGLAFTSLSLASMYIGEIAPAGMRGKLVAMNQVNIVIGLSAAFFANDGILRATRSGAAWVEAVGIADHMWRWMLATEIVPALVWLLLLLTIPESPRWLLQKGDADAARRAMSRLMPSGRIEAAIREIQASLGHRQARKSVASQLADLLNPRMRSVFWLGLVIAAVQPITGINSILFYAPMVFEQTGIGTDAAFTQAVVLGVVGVVATVLALLLIDRVGRRPMTLFGLTWAAASLFVGAWAFSRATYTLDAGVLADLAGNVDPESLRTLFGMPFFSDVEFKSAVEAVIGEAALRENESVLLANAANLDAAVILFAIVSFVAAFNFSIGPIMWVLLSEIFPIHVRSIAIPGFALVTSIVNYLVNQFFPWQLNNMGAAEILSIYAACIVVGLVVLFRILPETRNRTIEELELELARPGVASA